MVVTDPETLEYRRLDSELEAALQASFTRRVHAELAGRTAPDWMRLEVATARASTGERWLRLLSGEGTTWHVEWDLVIGTASETASEFAAMLVSDLKTDE